MRRLTSILIVLACLALRPATPAAAGWFDSLFDDTLVSIDGARYSEEDFKRWWKFWQEPEQKLPETPDPYIDWLLLAREGKRMQLDEDPGFQRNTRIFLLARTLLMLKHEAVDSRIEVTEEAIRERYEEKYLPRWQVQSLKFKDEEAARSAWEELKGGTLTLDELLAREPEQGGPEENSEDWVRASSVDPGWADIFRKLQVGEAVDPDEHKGGLGLFVLKDQKGADEEDLERFRKGIERDLWKEQQSALTQELLDQLREKYEVVVDEERIAALDINAPDETFTDEVVISSTQQKVSEKEFMVVIRKLMKTRPTASHAAVDGDLEAELKAETVDNIIAQSVTNWEALDRHYEEKEPFKWAYEFNYDHRLVLAVQAIYGSDAEVGEEEVERYYQENLEKYTQPALVQVNIIDDSQGPVDRVWADVMLGKAFKQAVKEHFEMQVETRTLPANHLDPEVKKRVDAMTVGDTSPIFNALGSRVIVHLVDRTPASPLSLERVARTIRTKLKEEKIKQVSDAYLEDIKSRSQIEIRERRWKAIRKELGEA